MKFIKILFSGFLLAGLFLSCNNHFHDLIPPDDNLILSFEIDGQIDNALIKDNEIIVSIESGTDMHSIVPRIKISKKAAIIPITLNYIKAAFPGIDVIDAAINLLTTEDLTEYVWNLVSTTPDFNVPNLDIPIDFSTTVSFLVVSGQGSIRQYRVNVVIDSGLPRLINFGFSKYDNEELIQDAFTLVNENLKTINSAVLYPAEMDNLSYALIPSFDILGDRIEVDGLQVRSGLDSIYFSKGIGIKSKIITIWRGDISLDFTLNAVFNEDPDSIRSIIDFRFNKTDNSVIAVNAVASIINNDSLGNINVQVFYTGGKPSTLKPRFVSPGTVSVNGITQTSGINSHDFSSSLEYRVVSRNNKYVRTYTVNTEFIDITASMPVINEFKFSSALNHELVQDAQAQISESTGQILISARYGGISAPVLLVPQFSAAGLVTVNGAVQTSSFSAQNFSRQIKYTVTNPDNPLLTRDYWVQVTFTRDISADAAITFFSFHPNENEELADELTGKIDHNAGKITIFAPVGSGVSAKIMYPRFTAAGQVKVNNAAQISGESGQVFESPVTYEVISANGANVKAYTVTVRELRSTIYVNCGAVGEGDGTSWSHAFRNLKDACEAALEFPEDVSKEIWIAKGTYKPSITDNREEYFRIAANTSYLGGFAGNETSKSERNPDANPVIVSGKLYNDVYSYNLFGSFNDNNSVIIINGDVTFENINFNGTRASSTSGGRSGGGAIRVNFGNESNEFKVISCSFNDFDSYSGGAIYSANGMVEILSSAFNNTIAVYGGAVYLAGNGEAKIDNVTIKNSSANRGGGIYTDKKITISGITIDTAFASNSGGGIYGGRSMIIEGSSSIIRNVKSDMGGAIFLQGDSYSSSISNLTIDTAEADLGGGIYCIQHLNIFNSHFKKIKANSYGAFFIASKNNNYVIEDSIFENVTARDRWKIFWQEETTIVSRCVFIHNNELPDPGVSSSNDEMPFFPAKGIFIDCTFTNLRSNKAGMNFIFNEWSTYLGSIRPTIELGSLELRNCKFNLQAGSAGIIAATTGYVDRTLYIEGMEINNNGGQQPIIWLNGSSGVFRFRLNCKYNNTLLDTAAKITGLGSNIIRFTNGAGLTIMP